VKQTTKRVISFLLCIIYLTGMMVVSADEQKPYVSLKLPGTIISTQYDEGGENVAYSVDLAPGRTGSNVSFNAPHWIEYTVEAEKDGFYDLTLYYASLNSSSTMDISIDGTLVFKAELMSTGAWGGASDNDTYIGRTKLTKGTHLIRCEMVASGVNFQKMVFEYYDPDKKVIDFAPANRAYRNSYAPTIIEAENYDIGPDGYVSNDNVNSGKAYRKNDGIDIFEIVKNENYYILLNNGEAVRYTFTVLEDGVYALMLNATGEGTVRVGFDGYPGSALAEFTGDSSAYSFQKVLDVYLPKGKHVLELKSESALINLDNLRFVHSSGDAIKLDSLKNGEEISFIREEQDDVVHNLYKELFVSETGSDTNDGSEKSPFKTLNRAKEEVALLRDSMTGDIVVNILPGYYPVEETVVFGNEHGGKDGHRVIYRGSNVFQRPVFSGGVRVDDWKKQDEHIWSAPLSEVEDVRNLYINGMAAQRARSKYVYVAQEGYVSDSNTGITDGIAMPLLNFPEQLTNPEDMELVWNVDWMSHRTPVRDLKRTKDKAILLMDMPYFSKALARSATNTRYPRIGNAFYLENAPELMDEPGEFYFDKKAKKIYYYPYEEENLLTDDVYVAKTEFLVNISGESADNPVTDIVFQNLDFRYGAWYLPSETGMLTGQADNVTLDVGMMMRAQVDITRADNITVKGCSFSSLGSSAITMNDAVTNASITGNIIKDCSGTGIAVGNWKHTNEIPEGMARCRNITVENNVLRRIGTEFKSAIGISLYYVNNVNVLHNDIRETSYTGIAMGWGWGEDVRENGSNTIAYNKVQNVMGTLHDGSHIYTLGPNRDTTVHDNHLIKTYDYRGGIYTDNGSSYIRYYNNVIEQCKHWWFTYSPDMHDLESYNNYSDTETFTNNRDDKVILHDNTAVTDGNWPKEALDIMANAGVEPQWEYLFSDVERPDWRAEYTALYPNKQFRNAEKRSWIEAEDYVDGSSTVVLYGSAKNYAVGDTADGTWLEYETEVAADDRYSVEFKYANAFPEDTPETRIDIYIDGELVMDDVHAPRTTSWSDSQTFYFGDLDIKAGKHTVKIVFVDNGFSFDRFRFISEKQLDELKKIDLNAKDPFYDEGVIK